MVLITQASMAPVTRVFELYRSKITAGNTLDVTAAGEAGLDLDNTSGTLDAAQFGADFITAAKIADNSIGSDQLDTDAITYFGIPTRVYDHDYVELPDQAAEKARRARWYAEVLQAQRQFVK